MNKGVLMNERVQALVSQSEGNFECFAKLLVKECSKVIENLKYTEEGPSYEVRFQRVLCARAIEEHFGLVGQAPIQPIND